MAILSNIYGSILPALAFSLDMFKKTEMSYGVNEVLLASALGSVVFAIFSAQPLVIVGVTGRFSDCFIMQRTVDLKSLQVQLLFSTIRSMKSWLHVAPTTLASCAGSDCLHVAILGTRTSYWPGCRWSLVMHSLLAFTNACNALTYVTRFTCDIFGFYVACIYLQKGVEVLLAQWDNAGETSAYFSIVVSLLVLIVGYGCGIIGFSSLFWRRVRQFIEDYGTPLTVIFFTGFVHIGRMRSVELTTLPTTKAFSPTLDRGWLVHFWDTDLGDIFIAVPFAILLTILFYFDHNGTPALLQPDR